MKKVIVLCLFFVFAFSAVASTVCYATDNAKEATKYEVVGLASLFIGSSYVSQGAKPSLGFITNYFSDMDVNPLSRAEKAIWEALMVDGDMATIDLLRKGKLVIENYRRSFRFIIPVSSGNRRELFNAQSTYRQGRIPQEWHQAQLPKSSIQAWDIINLGFATDSTVTVPEGDVDFGSLVDAWPAALRNAEIIISQNSAILGGVLEAKNMGSKAATFGSTVESDGDHLKRPIVLMGEKPTKIELFSPQDITFAATPVNQFLEISVVGAWLRARS